MPLFVRFPPMSNLEHENSFPFTHANSLKAAIFLTMSFKFSLEINNFYKKVLLQKRLFLKSSIMSVASRKRTFRIHVDGPKLAVCETASDSFVINFSFPSKNTFFHHALEEARDAFNATMLDVGYTQTLEPYNATHHQVTSPQNIHFTEKLIMTWLFHSCLLFLPFFLMPSSCSKLSSTSLLYLHTTSLILYCLAGTLLPHVVLFQCHHLALLVNSLVNNFIHHHLSFLLNSLVHSFIHRHSSLLVTSQVNNSTHRHFSIVLNVTSLFF